MPWIFALAWALGASMVVYGVAVLAVKVQSHRGALAGAALVVAGVVVLGATFVLGEARGVHGAHVYTAGTGEAGVAPAVRRGSD